MAISFLRASRSSPARLEELPCLGKTDGQCRDSRVGKFGVVSQLGESTFGKLLLIVDKDDASGALFPGRQSLVAEGVLALKLAMRIVSLGTITEDEDEAVFDVEVLIVIVVQRWRRDSVTREDRRSLKVTGQGKGCGHEVFFQFKRFGCDRKPIVGSQLDSRHKCERLQARRLAGGRSQSLLLKFPSNIGSRLLSSGSSCESSGQLVGSQILDVAGKAPMKR